MERLSRFTMNLRIPTIVGDMGEPLDHGEHVDEDLEEPQAVGIAQEGDDGGIQEVRAHVVVGIGRSSYQHEQVLREVAV